MIFIFFDFTIKQLKTFSSGFILTDEILIRNGSRNFKLFSKHFVELIYGCKSLGYSA